MFPDHLLGFWLQKEWLCLNCQTRRALSGELGDSGRMPQVTPVSAKPSALSTPATAEVEPKTTPAKAELTSVVTKSQLTPDSIKSMPTAPTLKPKMEPMSVEKETTATAASEHVKIQPTHIAIKETVSPVLEEKQPLAAFTAEVMPPAKDTATLKAEVPNTDHNRTVTVEDREESVKVEFIEPQYPNAEESKVDLSKDKLEADVASASPLPATEAIAVPFHFAAEVVPGNKIKPELSAPHKIKELLTDDHIELTEPTTSLPQAEVQPKSQEPQLVLEKQAAGKEMAEELIEKINDITLFPETQVSANNIIIQVSLCPLF